MDNFSFERWQNHADELCREASKQQFKDEASFYRDNPFVAQKTPAQATKVKENYGNEPSPQKPERSVCYFKNKKFQFRLHCKSISPYDNDYKFLSEAEFKKYMLAKRRKARMRKFTEAEKYYLSFEDLTPEQEEYLRQNNYKAFWKSREKQEAERKRVAKYYAEQQKAKKAERQAKTYQKPTYSTRQRAIAGFMGAMVALTISTGFNKTDLYHRTALNDIVEASQFEDTKGERIK